MIDLFISMFNDLTLAGWIGQISGLIGFVVILISFQLNKKMYCLVAGISMIFFLLESLLSAPGNISAVTVSLIRNAIMYYLILKNKGEMKKSLVWSLVALVWLGQILYMAITRSFDDFSNYLPPFFVTCLNILQNNKNYYVVKLGNLIQEGGCLIFFFIIRQPFSIFRQIILVSSILLSLGLMIRNDIKRKKSQLEINE